MAKRYGVAAPNLKKAAGSLEDAVVKVAKVIDAPPRWVEGKVDGLLTSIEGAFPGHTGDILFSNEQKTLLAAIAADIVDAFPLTHIPADFFRERHAAKATNPRYATQDIVQGVLPIIPYNTIRFVRKKAGLQ